MFAIDLRERIQPVSLLRAAVRRERAFNTWRDSGYRDTAAHGAYLAAMTEAGEIGRRAKAAELAKRSQI